MATRGIHQTPDSGSPLGKEKVPNKLIPNKLVPNKKAANKNKRQINRPEINIAANKCSRK